MYNFQIGKVNIMETKKETKRLNPLMNNQRSKLGLEIHNHKILPQLYKKNLLGHTSNENEWEQEYYIIYNSYFLEEKDFQQRSLLE